MSEQAPNPNHERDIDYESHRDETAYVRQRLTRLMDQGTPFAAGGEGLYISMPGKIYGGRNYIDKGCRGGWSESYEAALGDEPAELSLIRRRYNKLHLRLAGGGSTTLTPEEIAQANFLVDPARWHSELPDGPTDQAVQTRLRSAPYVSLSYDDIAQATDWQHAINVRSRHPLEYPVSYGQYNSGLNMEYSPLDGSFESIETYFDHRTETTMVQVIVSAGRRRNDTTATSWIPLNYLHFEVSRLSDRAAYGVRIGQLAAALCDGNPDTGPINQLLQQTASIYQLPYTVRTNRDGMERIVVGQTDNDSIRDITALPIARPEVFRDINMSAEQVVYDHHHPWVVSPDGLSLPLHRQGQFKRSEDDRWLMGKNIENLIDQAKRQAK